MDWQTTGEESGPGGTSGDDDPPPPPANSPATGAPSITGTARVGETLTADTSGIADADGLTGASFSYQWLADGSGISGATGSTYAPANADVGKAVKVRVSFTDDAGHAETLTSAATAAVAANPPKVTAVRVTSDPGSDDTYALGDVITISVTFDEAVNVTGAPRIAIDMDPAEWGTKLASYQGGSGTRTLTFTHTVVEPNYSTQGIALLANTLALNGGDIESKATGRRRQPVPHRPGPRLRHKVDWRLSDEEKRAPDAGISGSAPTGCGAVSLSPTARRGLTRLRRTPRRTCPAVADSARETGSMKTGSPRPGYGSTRTQCGSCWTGSTSPRTNWPGGRASLPATSPC